MFYTDSLSAIIDFDRFQYIYPELDISRAILSFALYNNCLRMDAVKAFIINWLNLEKILGELKNDNG